MSQQATSPGILLVDDGELDEVAHVLDAQNLAYERLRGGQIPAEIAPPRDLLIVTPRRLERVRPGSPADAPSGRPLRIIAVTEDSPAMRRRMRRAGLHLLVRVPADAEIWRLLVARALYHGAERRADTRVTVGSPIDFAGTTSGAESISATLVDLSNRGCRIRTGSPSAFSEHVAFTLPASLLEGHDDGPLSLSGRVVRVATDAETGQRTLAIVFDADLSEEMRTRLTALINLWAAGPHSMPDAATQAEPAIPPCQLASLPDLVLDDETDPPISARGEIRFALEGASTEPQASPTPERRAAPRGAYPATMVANGAAGPLVLIGRDLSRRGMRIERHVDLALGDRYRIALRGPGRVEPFVVSATVARDDGDDGFGLVFDPVDRATAQALEKLVACLPDVESLAEGEIGGLGAVLSEIVPE
ncbi:MAG TPA: PilZ domain-containing protein [Myxococcota bacterium]|nr:PilZ domain-containing protein [Myxococcales bacterium]HPG25437.1 PilZ domain-containing protein [Myxococcota bacterium]